MTTPSGDYQSPPDMAARPQPVPPHVPAQQQFGEQTPYPTPQLYPRQGAQQPHGRQPAVGQPQPTWQQAPGGYPNAGTASVPDVRGPIPSTVRWAVYLMFLGAILEVGALLAEAKALGATGGSAGAVNSLLGGAAGIGIILWIWLALANRAGRQWARVLGTVLFAFDVIACVSAAVEHISMLQVVADVAEVALGAAITMLLWSGPSRQHYATRRR